jgi:hypothetical protein
LPMSTGQLRIQPASRAAALTLERRLQPAWTADTRQRDAPTCGACSHVSGSALDGGSCAPVTHFRPNRLGRIPTLYVEKTWFGWGLMKLSVRRSGLFEAQGVAAICIMSDLETGRTRVGGRPEGGMTRDRRAGERYARG